MMEINTLTQTWSLTKSFLGWRIIRWFSFYFSDYTTISLVIKICILLFIVFMGSCGNLSNSFFSWNVQEGKLKTYKKSEAIPEANDEPVKVVVADNLHDFVLKSGKNGIYDFAL